MTDKNTGGPAFPNPGGHTPPSQGMTLRDYFAAKSLQTISAYSSGDVSTWSADDFAGHAYAIADAMLRARQS